MTQDSKSLISKQQLNKTMNSVTLNKYSSVNVQELSSDELCELRRGLECDIAWTEHDLKSTGTDNVWGKTDLLLDNLQIYNNLYKRVLEKLN